MVALASGGYRRGHATKAACVKFFYLLVALPVSTCVILVALVRGTSACSLELGIIEAI